MASKEEKREDTGKDDVIRVTTGVQKVAEAKADADADDKEKAKTDDGLAASGAKSPRKTRRLNLLDFQHLAPWKRAMVLKWSFGLLILGIVYLAFALWSMAGSSAEGKSYWWNPNSEHVQENLADAEQRATAENAVRVRVGTYVENIRSIDIKSSNTNVTMLIWFRWDGSPDLDMADNYSIYHGLIQSTERLRDDRVGDTNYQLIRINVDVNGPYTTALFPLDSQQVKVFVESSYKAREVIFVPDTENSTINSSLQIAGYKITNTEWSLAAHQYSTTEADPSVTEPPITSEYVTAITFQRDGFGLYFKCFIAMYGTTLWVLIMLYICGHHRVDPLGMIPGALFGTVSNIMVGAALLPDALDLGLLEFVNVWGILTILATAVVIIQINNIRSEYGRKDEPFAGFFGRVMFYVIAVMTIAGNLVLPLVAAAL